MERCPLCGAKTVNTKGYYQMILTVEMLREIAKDVDVVASSHLGRQNIKGLMLAAAEEIERLQKVSSNMASAVADDAGKGDTEEAAEPPTEKEMAREMAPKALQKGKKSHR